MPALCRPVNAIYWCRPFGSQRITFILRHSASLLSRIAGPPLQGASASAARIAAPRANASSGTKRLTTRKASVGKSKKKPGCT